MKSTLLGSIRHARLIMRGSALTVIVTFASLLVSPTVLAVKADVQRKERTQPLELNENSKLAQLLSDVKDALSELNASSDNAIAAEQKRVGNATKVTKPPKRFFEDTTTKTRLAKLKELRKQVAELDRNARRRFDEVSSHLNAHNVSPIIVARQEEAIRQYRDNMEALLAQLDTVERAKDDEVIYETFKKAHGLMKDKQQKRSHQFTDPNHLPFGPPDIKVREPFTDEKKLQALVTEPVMVASADDSQLLLLAALSPNPAPNSADLAETEDVQITPAVKALADELNHEPVRIYNWVYNNVEFIPSYGSVQGSDATLQTKRGNAFDSASLLIGLLRASGIHARYAYGTVRIPADKVMNWVGGVTTPEAAINLLGQGGVPVKGLVQNGVIKFIELEHVWVEAWLDYVPARAARHIQGDSWVTLDPSFKQYSYSRGLNVTEVLPFDAAGLTQQINDSATINDQESWIQGVDVALVHQQLASYQARVQEYIDTNGLGATPDGLIGAKRIIARSANTLATRLPYQHIATTQSVASLPASLRHKFRFALLGPYGEEALTFQRSTVQIAGKQLALSFAPASEADLELIASYLPDLGAGDQLDESSFRLSLPGYLIKLVAEWTVDGQVVATSAPLTMGTELQFERGMFSPGTGWALRNKALIAGEYHAISANPQGVSPMLLDRVRTELEGVKSSIDEGSPTGLTKHKLTGALLQAGILDYMALNEIEDELQARAAGVVTYRHASWGGFSTTARIAYWFGMPRQVGFTGVVMDVDQLRSSTVANDNNREKWVAFNRSSGARASAYEHTVPEQLFGSAVNPNEGISAVKALTLASEAGQRIYRVTSANHTSILPLLTIATEVKDEIRSAANAGREITVSQGNINHYGWTGAGYIILDPETGAAAYKIAGGANGGSIADSILAAVAGILGYVDGSLQWLDKYKPVWFSETLKHLEKLAKYSTVAGWLGLAAGIVNAINGDATGWNLVGQIAVNMFAFAATVVIVGAVAAATGPILGALLGFAIAVGISMLMAEFSRRYF